MVPVSFIQFSYWLWSQTGPSFDPAKPKAAASTGFSVFSCQNFFRSCGLVKKWCLTHAGFHEKRDVSGKASPKNSQSVPSPVAYFCSFDRRRLATVVRPEAVVSADSPIRRSLAQAVCVLPVWTRMVWPEPVGSRIGICGDSDSKLSRSAFV